jgi:hypothetical protein
MGWCSPAVGVCDRGPSCITLPGMRLNMAVMQYIADCCPISQASTRTAAGGSLESLAPYVVALAYMPQCFCVVGMVNSVAGGEQGAHGVLASLLSTCIPFSRKYFCVFICIVFLGVGAKRVPQR